MMIPNQGSPAAKLDVPSSGSTTQVKFRTTAGITRFFGEDIAGVGRPFQDLQDHLLGGKVRIGHHGTDILLDPHIALLSEIF
jgi:hypothetical protein